MDKGFIKLSRKFFSNDMWNEARTFSSCEAWLDLIQSARFEATSRKVSIGGREVSYKRGQYPASVRYLTLRWSWTERKVRTFLSHLKKDGMITIECTQGMNIITLCNYDEYNSNDTANDTASDTDISFYIRELRSVVTQLMTQKVTHGDEKRHTGDTNTKKEEEYIKKENTPKGVSKNDAAKAATLSRKDIFYQSLIPFVGKYSKEMIRIFFDYWSELNKSGSKMRFEIEKTWELPKRLATWANNERIPKSKADVGIVLRNNSPDKYEKPW